MFCLNAFNVVCADTFLKYNKDFSWKHALDRGKLCRCVK